MKFFFKLAAVMTIAYAIGFALARATKAEGASDTVDSIPAVTLSKCADEKRYPIASLQVAFAITFPEADQGMLSDKTKVDAYLHEYNNFGTGKSDVTGDEIFQVILPDGTIFGIALRDGLSCTRFIVGPTLNKIITKKIARTTM